MTDFSRTRPLSAAELRGATFTQRRRGLDEQEVHAFLDSLANQVQAAESEHAALRAEIDRLRHQHHQQQLQQQQQQSHQQDPGEINANAVALFSQAQQVADRLVAEAVEHARDLMASARAQQREILQRAHDAAQAAARETPTHHNTPDGRGYDTPVPEIEYVRTFARIAQTQLQSVLDALNEQVDKLGELPRLDDEPAHQHDYQSGNQHDSRNDLTDEPALHGRDGDPAATHQLTTNPAYFWDPDNEPQLPAEL